MIVSGARIEPDALLYSWGHAKGGKLGISDNYFREFEQENLSQFFS